MNKMNKLLIAILAAIFLVASQFTIGLLVTNEIRTLMILPFAILWYLYIKYMATNDKWWKL